MRKDYQRQPGISIKGGGIECLARKSRGGLDGIEAASWDGFLTVTFFVRLDRSLGKVWRGSRDGRRLGLDRIIGDRGT